MATAAFFGHGLDPDEHFVAQTNLPVGKLSFEVLENKTGVHLPARLFFAYVDGRPDVPTVGRFQNILVTVSGREVKPELVFWPFRLGSINPLSFNWALPGKFFLRDTASGFQPLFPSPKNSSPGHPEPAFSDTFPFLWDIGIISLGAAG